jgi:K+-transporting ATPase ATPase C chain
MIQQLRISVLMLVSMTLLTGVLYPFVVTGIAQVVFPHQANGSLIMNGDRIVGSELVGQSFSDSKYFWGRLSATSPVPYSAATSGGSNYGPLHPSLKNAAVDRVAQLSKAQKIEGAVPIDLLTASGSGLDPHISLEAAEFQVARVAAARGTSEDGIRELVKRNTLGRQWMLFGEPTVNVLKLNLALDHFSK